MMFAGADYYIQHPMETEPETPITFEEMPLRKFAELVSEASLSNSDRVAAAIAKADSFSFQTVHSEFLPTENNTRLINHWLQTKGITNPIFPNFVEAYESYKGSGLLDLDPAELARDKKQPRTFTGVFTKQTFHSVDDLIAAERNAALTQIVPVSDEEKALEQLPLEQAQAVLKQAERMSQQQVNRSEVQAEGDAWLSLHREWVDDVRNAKLMLQQLRANGVTNATIADYEKASQQLRASGLVKLSKAELEKQQVADINQRATEAAASVFDTTSEDQMYNLPLDEIRRRANGNFSGVGL